MHKLKPLLLIILGSFIGIACIALAVTIGVFDIPDSFFYATLAQYFYTGEVFPIQPFNLYKPQTLFGPVYGLIVVPLISQPWPFGMVMVPLLQLLLLVIGATLMYLLMKKHLPRPWPFITAAVYVLLPFQIIYATFMMSETLTATLLLLWIVILDGWLNGKKWSHPALLVLVAAVATLTRYVFQMLFYISLAIWIWDTLHLTRFLPKFLSHLHMLAPYKKRLAVLHLPALVGIGIIAGWMYFNFRINDVWALSILQGRHIYNNVVTVGHFLPPDDHPIMKFFLERYGRWGAGKEVMYDPWWDVQLILNDGIIPEWKVDQLYRDLSLAAIKTHPIPYALHVARMTYNIATTAPYHPEGFVEKLNTCSQDVTVNPPVPICRFKWNKYLCEPAVRACGAQSAFATFATASINFYPVGGAILYLLSGIGIIVSLLKRKPFFIWVSGLFAIQHVLASATEWVEGRFLIPLYPLYAILIVVAVQWIWQYTTNHRRKDNSLEFNCG